MKRIILLLMAALLGGGHAVAEPVTALSMHGPPLLPANFAHVRYVNPAAPKGGKLVVGVQGTFDSLNPFVIRGISAQGIRHLVYETLLARHYNEPFALYGLLAESVEVPPDRSSIIFNLNPAARFSDDQPVTAEDVLFSFKLLRDKGRPNHRGSYSKVREASVLSPTRIRFDLSGIDDLEMPLILGLMPILPRHVIDPERFEDVSMRPPVGSGPYGVHEVRAGESITLRRRPTYWGRDLPINRGLYNVDDYRYDYFRDGTSLFEAFRKGLVDYRVELDPARWARGYDFPAVRDGLIRRDEITTTAPKGLATFAFNTRRDQFRDKRVRQAIALLFDFEWVNRTFFSGLYRRTTSVFEGSELSALGRPVDATEQNLLKEAGIDLPPDLREGTYRAPTTDGSGQDRVNLRAALALFEAAGYRLDQGVLKATASGQPLAFEILTATREQERLALALQQSLKRAGIMVQVRNVDPAQYDRRVRDYDFDMTQHHWGTTSLSPGNEQYFYWGSQAGKMPGSRNLPGIDDPAIDRLIGALVSARDRDELVSTARALDRSLMAGHYWIPLFHAPTQWIARWNKVKMPGESSIFGYLPETWWVDDTLGR